MPTEAIAVELLCLISVASAIPSTRHPSLYHSSTPSEPSCKSISSMATHDWCAINCAADVCPPQTCRCGDAPAARADAHIPTSQPLKLADIDASTCISVSPTATSYWCQLKCSNGGHCPERLCQCEKAAVTEAGQSAPNSHPAQPKPWWRMNKKREEAEPKVAEPAPDPATQPKQQPSWSRTAQPKAWWRNGEVEPTQQADPTAAGTVDKDGGGCPSYVSLADDVQSAFSQVDDLWCESNCRGGNCPADKCICSTDADAIHTAMGPDADVDARPVVPSPGAAPSAHPAQPTPWWRANKKRSSDESDSAKQQPRKNTAQPTPWWRDCGDQDCKDKQSDQDKASAHPAQPAAWWKHEEEKAQHGAAQDMEGYMYPGANDWKDSAEIYEEGADQDYESKLEPEPVDRGKTQKLPSRV